MKIPFQMSGISNLWARREDNVAKKSWMGDEMSNVFCPQIHGLLGKRKLYKSWIDMNIILGTPDLKIGWKRSKTTLHLNS